MDRAVYELNVVLRDVEPRVWRQVQVSEDTTLPDLHRILQILFEWSGTHAHEFALRHQVYGYPNKAHPDGTILDEKGVPLKRVLPNVGDELTYVYDFGDNWRLRVTLDRVIFTQDQSLYPRCVDGEQPAPPENSGGPYAYSARLRANNPEPQLKSFSGIRLNEALRRQFERKARW